MRVSTVVFIALSVASAESAADDLFFLSQKASLTVMPLYQQWSIRDGASFSQSSVAVSVYYPFARDFSVLLLGAQATTGGDVTKINSLTDTQILMQYHLETPNVFLSCGLNFPSGKRELTQDEFATTLELSNEVFNFKVPNYGQGFNVNSGFTWAMPMGDDFAMGLGAAYQYKGKFRPLAGLDEYDPGDEILIAGGFDVRLSQAATLASDVIFTTCGKDKLGGAEVFAAGNRWVANLQFRQYFDQNELWLFVRYRTKGKNEVAVGSSLVPEAEKLSPNQFDVLGHYRIQFSDRISARFLVEGRFFEKTAAPFSGTTLFGAGVAPEVSLSPTVSIPARFKFYSGTMRDGGRLSGFEADVGMSVSF
jgi:hypothetical protein